MRFILAVVLLLSALVAFSYGSSHSEAPGTAKMPPADNTDFYAFRSYEPTRLTQNYVTFLMNIEGLQSPFGGPNYYSFSDQHFYEIYIDNDGNLIEDLVYQFIYGNSLGGELINGTIYPADFDCTYQGLNNTLMPGGITLPIGPNGGAVPIPLKFAGPINAGGISPLLNWVEYYSLNVINGNRNSGTFLNATNAQTGSSIFYKPFDNAGEKTFPSYSTYADQYIYNINVPYCGGVGQVGSGRVFAGQRADGFAVNLGGIFDLINFVPIPTFPGAIQQSSLNNALANKNVGTFALEVQTTCLLGTGTTQGVIGTWLGIRQLKHDPLGNHFAGAQVSRLGNPLVNEVVIGLRDKYVFNAGIPTQDGANGFGVYVLYPTLPALVNALFLDTVNSVLGAKLTTLAPTTPRNDLVTVFLTGIPGLNKPPGNAVGEVLRLNTSIPPLPAANQSTLGVIGGDVAGFPNGRRPGDDVIDIALQVVVAGILCGPAYKGAFGCNTTQAPIYNVALTDGAPVTALDFQNKFPYLNYPYPGYGNGTQNYYPTTTSSPSAGPSFPSLIAISIALVAGFFISFAFFAF